MLNIVTGKKNANFQIMSKTKFTALELIALEIIQRATKQNVILYRDSEIVLDNAILLSDETFGYITFSYTLLYLEELLGNTDFIPDLDKKAQLLIEEITNPSFIKTIELLNCSQKNPSKTKSNKQLYLAKKLVSTLLDAVIDKLFF